MHPDHDLLHANEAYAHRPGRVGHVNLSDCEGHTIPTAQLPAFLLYGIGNGDLKDPSLRAFHEAAVALAAYPENALALAVVQASEMDDVLNERTAVLYACWVLEGRPGYMDDPA